MTWTLREYFERNYALARATDYLRTELQQTTEAEGQGSEYPREISQLSEISHMVDSQTSDFDPEDTT